MAELLELDMDPGPLRDHLELANLYRHETRNYVRACLGLTNNSQLESFKSSDATIQAFEIIGKVIRQIYNYGSSSFWFLKRLFEKMKIDWLQFVEQRQRFMNTIEIFLDMTRQEQMQHLRNTLPAIEEYWSYRLGTSGALVIIAINEWVLKEWRMENYMDNVVLAQRTDCFRFTWDMNLQTSVMENINMKLLWKHTNIIIST